MWFFFRWQRMQLNVSSWLSLHKKGMRDTFLVEHMLFIVTEIWKEVCPTINLYSSFCLKMTMNARVTLVKMEEHARIWWTDIAASVLLNIKTQHFFCAPTRLDTLLRNCLRLHDAWVAVEQSVWKTRAGSCLDQQWARNCASGSWYKRAEGSCHRQLIRSNAGKDQVWLEPHVD